jgi:endonuclease-3
MNPDLAISIISELIYFYGDLSPDLIYSTPYELMVAVVLSAQTTDRQVNNVTPALFAKYPDFKALASADLNEVEGLIISVGFYHTKAKNIIAAAKRIINENNGKLPSERDRLMDLPGIGRKSANVILSIAFNKPAFAVDTHVLRISNRLGLSHSHNPTKVETDITSMIPPHMWKNAHLALIRHGRKICMARLPLCSECPVSGRCQSAYKLHKKP